MERKEREQAYKGDAESQGRRNEREVSFEDVQNPCSAIHLGSRQKTEGKTLALFPFSFALSICMEATLQNGDPRLPVVLTPPHFCPPADLSYGHGVVPPPSVLPGTTLGNTAHNSTAYRTKLRWISANTPAQCSDRGP